MLTVGLWWLVHREARRVIACPKSGASLDLGLGGEATRSA